MGNRRWEVAGVGGAGPPVAGRASFRCCLVAMGGETVAWEVKGSHPLTLGAVSPSQKGEFSECLLCAWHVSAAFGDSRAHSSKLGSHGSGTLVPKP